MEHFIKKHQSKITGVLSCFDRVLVKGYLPIGYPAAMEKFMSYQRLLLKDFKGFVTKQSEILKNHAVTMAERSGRPYIYLRGRIRKEERARQIAKEDGITEGLICVFSIVEQCQSFKLAYGEGKPRIVSAKPRCLCLYFYYIDREFGFMHVRIQTWFPFVIQVYVNGHEWLARKMDRHGIRYRQVENAFVWIEDLERAQRFADKLADKKWLRFLDTLARRINPHLKDLLAGMRYYWVVDQAEFATDVLFSSRSSLKGLYQKLLRHATVCFSAEDVMTFLGRKLYGNFSGEVIGDFKKRWLGARIKHRMKSNWIKMYDKHGCVLRVETVINHPYEFKIRRQGIRRGEIVTGWFPMIKGISNLYRYAQVSLIANKRYLEALSVVDDPAESYRLLDRLCEPAIRNGRRHRGLNPLKKNDVALFVAALNGEHFIHGFRNRDVARHLGMKLPQCPVLRKRQNARVYRLLQLLRAHRLIAKIPRSRRYRLTTYGATIMSAAVYLHQEDFHQSLQQMAA